MFKNLNNLTDIEKFAKIWQTELNMEYLKPEKNVRLSFKDIGPFCEYLATSFLPGYTGGGSGGMGFDLFNKKDGKAFEIKSCCTIQNAKCLNCNSKFNSLFSTVCPICKSSNFININDSRFGINADETLKQIEHDIFAGFIFFHISQTNNDTIKHNLSVKVETFILQFNSSLKQIQLEYFINQNNLGRKPHCNLLPGSFDFYKLCPVKIYESNIVINYANLNKKPLVNSKNCNEYPRVPLDILKSNEKEVFIKLSSYDPNTQTADCIDFTKNIPYRKKTLGKLRGDTRTNLYNRLTKK